jgi:hypothetical protein
MKSLRKVLAHLGLTFLLLVVLLIASAFGAIYYVVVPALVVLTLCKRYYFEAFVCVLGPSVMASAFAVANYVSGSGKLGYMGLPHMDFFNIDPVYRCGRVTGGCLVNGNEWITEEPYNLTLQSLISLFGPQRGSYTGPYPTEDDAAAALTVAAPIDLASIEVDQCDVNGVRVHLDVGVGKKMLRYWLGVITVADVKRDPFYADSIGGPITGAIWKNRVLILRGPPSKPTIAAIDLTAGRPFAYYQGQERFPPVMWRRADDLN